MKTCAPNMVNDAIRPHGDDHVTENRNRKLIRVTSSNERREQKCDTELKHQSAVMPEHGKFTYRENLR